MNDLRYALRMLRKNLGFTLIALVTLALGIGANTAVFSMVHALLLRPESFSNLERLMSVAGSAPRLGIDLEPVSPADYLEWKEQNGSFEKLSAQSGTDANLTGGETPERVRIGRFTPGFLAMLPVRPRIGRDFTEEEGKPGRDAVVLLSHGIWTQRFGGRADVLGRSIRIDGRERVVVGVMPHDFDFPRGTDVWTPLAFMPEDLARRDLRYLSVVGLLRPGVSRRQAATELATIAESLARRFPATNSDRRPRVRTLREALAGPVAPTFYGLLTLAAAFVLLIACVNVANLLLARASARRREIAVRVAMGASRARLLRQLLIESLLVALLGASAGLLVALWGVDFMVKSIPATITRFIPGWSGFGIDAAVLAFAVAVAVFAGLVFGLAPSLETLRVNVHDALKEGRRTATGGMAGIRARKALVVAEVALALVLVSGAGLVVQGFQRLLRQSPGFDPRGVLMLRVTLPETRYPEAARIAEYQRQALERLRSLPRSLAAAAGTRLPWSDWGGRGMTYPLDVAGAPAVRPEDRARTALRTVSRGYFEALRIPILAGRGFEGRDHDGAEGVAVVSRALARRIDARGDVVGRLLRFEHPRLGGVWRRVVGVCGDVTHTWWENDPAPLCYVPHDQAPYAFMVFAVRAAGDPMALAPAARATLLELDREQPVYAVATLQLSMDEIFSPLKLSASLMTMFAVLALLLAMVGVYGLIAYTVSQRTHEIGVRLALGAQRASVLGLVIRQGMSLALLGLLAGLPVTYAMGRLAASKLFGVVALDPAVLAAISISLLGVAFLASYLPARNASRVDPMVALRTE